FVAKWNPDCVAVLVPVPQMGFLLDGVTRVGLKMLLNALSTCTMVRLGRVMGNTMIWVVPSNLKLIDRATRYIRKLTGLDYAKALQGLMQRGRVTVLRDQMFLVPAAALEWLDAEGLSYTLLQTLHQDDVVQTLRDNLAHPV